MKTAAVEDEEDGLDDVITFKKTSKDWYLPVQEWPKTESGGNECVICDTQGDL